LGVHPVKDDIDKGVRAMSASTGVPLCDLQIQLKALEPKLSEAAVRVLQSGQVIGGPEVSGLEAEVAQYCGAGHGVACSSGSDALLLALAALDIGQGDEVICPPFTFFATVGAICRTGARPVFADIDPNSYNIDPAQIEAKITSKTKAIMIVHLFGQCAEMDPIWDIAERHGLPIIEDSAQAIGSEYRGKRTGTLGAMSCYSFYPSKNLGAYGDAGMIVTNDAEWSAKMMCLRNHGMEPKYHHKYMGWNGRCDAIQAALLRVKLPHLDSWTEKRQAAADRYDTLLDEYALAGTLQKPARLPHRRHVFNQYVVRVAHGQRDALVRHFRNDKIGCEIYYPIPLHLQECLKFLGHAKGDFPMSEAAASSVLAFPMFPEITLEQQRSVVQSVAAFIRAQSGLAA
jgi:dTDP-4-amino-4,6-dideoxygalactose transaminase